MTNAEMAVLSLVAEQPRHGYEIEQVIEERGMREWTEIGFSSIYYLLKKLEREGTVDSVLAEAERGPARRVYRITPAGRRAFKVGLLEALSVPQRCYPPLQLGLANLPALELEEVRLALRKHQQSLNERLTTLQARWESQRPLPFFVDAMFDHSETMIRAETQWLDRFLAQLDKEEQT